MIGENVYIQKLRYSLCSSSTRLAISLPNSNYYSKQFYNFESVKFSVFLIITILLIARIMNLSMFISGKSTKRVLSRADELFWNSNNYAYMSEESTMQLFYVLMNFTCLDACVISPIERLLSIDLNATRNAKWQSIACLLVCRQDAVKLYRNRWGSY